MNVNRHLPAVNKISFNDGMNYGQFRFDTSEIYEYELIVGRKEFIEAIEDSYDQAREEIQADDLACGEESEFSRTGYVSVEKMFSYPEELESIISIYLDKDLFQKLLSPKIETGYIINSTDQVAVSKDIVRIKGRTFRFPVNQ